MNNLPVIPHNYGSYSTRHHVQPNYGNYGAMGDRLGTAGKIILFPTIGTIVGIGLAIPTSIILEKVMDKAGTKDKKLKNTPFYVIIAMPIIGGLLGGFAGIMSSLTND